MKQIDTSAIPPYILRPNPKLCPVEVVSVPAQVQEEKRETDAGGKELSHNKKLKTEQRISFPFI